MIASLSRLFQPLDTSEADAALDRLAKSQKAVTVRARALGMDVGCAEICDKAQQRVRQIVAAGRRVAGQTLRQIYQATVDEPIPDDLKDLLGKLD